jgi:hypothetical protein
MRSIIRLTAATLVAGLAIAAAGQTGRVSAAGSTAHSSAGLAGRWGVDVIFVCNAAVKGKNSCHVPELQMTLVTLTARADGTFTFVETDVAQATDPRAPRVCGPSLLGNGNIQFNGQCVYGSTGTGYFAPSKKTGALSFWLKSQTYHFANGTSYHNPPQAGKYPLDTGVPVHPAVLNNQAAAKIFGAGPVPAGITVRIVVTHTT